MAQRLDDARELTVDDTTVTFRIAHGDGALPAYLHALSEAQVPVRTASVATSTLDDVFLTLTGRSLREEFETDRAADELVAS